MGMLDHWQPVLLANAVRKKPVAVMVAGEPIAVFRTEQGELAALADACPHRRLKLSAGTVVGERLRCQYHGWTFDRCGQGESPGSPKLHACATSYDVRIEHGLVWLKSRSSEAVFPDVRAPGFFPICKLQHTIPAPLELAVDNFTEIEHSGTVHSTFGYDLDRMHEVKVRFETTESSVRVVNAGPTKRINRMLAWVLGVRRGDTFHDDWTSYFSPLYSVYDHWWTSSDGSREAMARWRLYLFFVPIDEKRTLLTTLAYAKSRYPGPAGGLRLARRFLRKQIEREVTADVEMLQHLADYSTDIEGLKLSRFDKVLGLTRDRIRTIYRGEPRLRIAIA